MAGDATGSSAGDMLAEDMVAAERTDALDLLNGGWVGPTLQLLALAGGGFSG